MGERFGSNESFQDVLRSLTVQGLATPAGLATPGDQIYINVRDYGAVGDGVTDDAAAINAAIAVAASNVLYFPASDGYAVASAIVVPAGISVLMDAPLIYTGSANVAALTIGSAGAQDESIQLRLMVERQTLSDWSSEANIGIKLINLSQSTINVIRIQGFTIALQLNGDNGGCDINVITLGRLHNAKVALDLLSANGGWVNDNLFSGGNFTLDGATCHPTLSRYGVRVGGSYANNNNVFEKPCFQLKGDSCVMSGQEVIPIEIALGENNHFLHIRNESLNNANGSRAASPCMRVANASEGNRCAISLLSGDASLQDTSAKRMNFITLLERPDVLTTIFDSGAVHKRATIAPNGYLSIPGMHFAYYEDASINLYDGGACTLGTDSLNLNSRGVGIFVNTQEVKTFVVRRDVDLSAGGSLRIRCFDVNGDVMNGSNPILVTTSISYLIDHSFSWLTSYGGAYAEDQTVNVGPDDFFFTVADSVQKIAVLIVGAKLRAFQVLAASMRTCAVWSGLEAGSAAVETVTPVFSSGAIHKLYTRDGSSHIVIPRLHQAYSGNATLYANDSSDSITAAEDYLTFASYWGVGVLLNTREVKQFIVRRDVDLAQGGLIRVRCYDNSLAVMDGTGLTLIATTASSEHGVYWNSEFGGTYKEDTDVTTGPLDFSFTVTDDVKRIAVLVTGAKLRSFQILAMTQRDVAAWSGL